MQSRRFLIGLFFLVSLPLCAIEEPKRYEHMVSKYLEAYRNYLNAKISGDQSAPKKLKEYNIAFSEFQRVLMTGDSIEKTTSKNQKGQKTEIESPEPVIASEAKLQMPEEKKPDEPSILPSIFEHDQKTDEKPAELSMPPKTEVPSVDEIKRTEIGSFPIANGSEVNPDTDSAVETDFATETIERLLNQ